MPGDSTKPANTDKQQEQLPKSGSLPITISPTAWYASNLFTVAAATNIAILSVQSPTKTLLARMAAQAPAVPSMSGGTFGFFRALYAGTKTSIYGSAARTTYVTTTKNNRPTENLISESVIREETALEESIRPTQKIPFSYTMHAAFWDLAITQIPDSLSQMKKTPGLLPPNFKWYAPYNIRALLLNGFSARYASGIINFTAMLQFETWMANQLNMQNSASKHATAGAISGAVGALAAYPFASLKDLTLARTKVSHNGLLVNETTFNVLKSLYNDFHQNPAKAVKDFFTYSGKQIPLRMALSAMIFSIIAGVGEKLGPTPLEKVVPQKYQPDTEALKSCGLFATKEKAQEAKTVPEVSPTRPGPK
ncbi:hypothetical protein J2N86_11665 [Legionella lytica]|uniref:Periplasmic ligand-binding sensor domain protein n=1 Tax=Legionella lytica TaxID=96232 RepID=A0ABY4Y6S7_9GAMM|nr:hypothetical protein [Legionella lytica]USQ13335.1 hypothetical protein J2N86_11665 [Legionella lytica]